MATDQFSLPENVHRRLRSLSTQIRTLSSIRGFGIGLTICAAVIACCVLLDWMIELPQWIRFGLLGAFCLTAVACVVRCLIIPLVQRFDASELATLLESGNPELKESVSSTIELSDESIPDQHRGSRFMREQLTRRTAKAAASAMPSNSVSPKSSLMGMTMGLTAIFLLIVPFFVWPSSSRLMAARFFQPWENLDRPTNLYFEVLRGNRVIAHGSDAKIVAVPRWREQEEERPESVLVNWSYTDGQSGSKRMQWDGGESAYVAEIRHVVSDFDYHITSGSARSKQYHIQAVTAPAVETLLLDVEPPPYSGLPAEHHDGIIGEVRAFERSNLRFSITFNKPVKEASFLWRVDTAAADVPPQTLPLSVAEDRLSATFEFAAVESGRFQISLRDHVDLANEGDNERELFVIIDRAPLIQFVGGMKSQVARPDAVFEVGVTASDDIGLGEMSLHYFVEDTEVGSIPFEQLDRGARRSDHVFQLKLAELDIPEGVAFSFKARVADERPIPGPNVSWTEDRSLILSADADSIDKQELTRQQEELRDRIREIREQVTKDRNEVRKQKDATRNARKKDEDFKDDKKLVEMASGEFKLSEKLEEISQELDKHPLFKELVDRAQDVSRKDMPKASEELGNASRKPNLTDKEQALTEAEKSLNNAEWKLRNIEERFTDLADLEKDIADLDQLAKDTDKLADNVEELEKQKQQAAAERNEKAKEEALQDLVDQQNELFDKQQQIEQELNELNEKRPELAEAARKAQMDKLKKIAQEARELANRENHLANSFQNEANENRNQTRNTLRKAREAQRAAEQLDRQMKQKGLKDTVDPEPLRKAVEELQRGNLEDPEKAMSEAAKQFGQKSEQLENANPNQQPPGEKGGDNKNSDQPNGGDQKGRKQTGGNQKTKPSGGSQTGKNGEEKPVDNDNKSSGKSPDQQSGKADRDKEARQKLSPEDRKNLAKAAENARKKAQEVAKELQQMQKQQQQAAGQNQQNGDQKPGGDQNQDAGSTPDGEKANDPANGKEADPKRGELQPTELAKKQRELAKAAEAMAKIMEAEKGQRDAATKELKRAAQEAKQSADLAQAGFFKEAAKSASKANEREQNSSHEAAKQGDARAKDLADRAKQLADAQKKHAEELKKAGEAPESGRKGRREGQKQAAQEMEKLAQQLQETAEQLNSQPVDMPQQGSRAQQAQQSAQKAQQQAQQASENAAQNSPEKASKSARKAAQELQQAANKAQQASSGRTKQTPVPKDVGEQFAKAMKSVKEAGKELGQQPGTQETGDQQGQKPGEKGEEGKGKGEGEGQKGEGQKGQGQKPGQQPGQTGQKQEGQQQQGAGKSSKQLRDAAKQMSDAAKNALPKNGQGKTGDQGQSRTGENTEPGGAPKGESDRLKALLGDRREGRDWGKLPGHLQTEILQGAQKNPNGDYARLIRMYFKEIAKATESSKKPAAKGNDK